jgi:hypothetical protein
LIVGCRAVASLGAFVVVNFAPFDSSRSKIGFPGEKGVTPSRHKGFLDRLIVKEGDGPNGSKDQSLGGACGP